MRASIAGGVIHSTDYFSSRDRDEGRAWLVMHGVKGSARVPRAVFRVSRKTVPRATMSHGTL